MELLSIVWANALNVIGFSFSMVFLLLLLIVIILSTVGKLFASFNNPQKVKNSGKKTSGSDLSVEKSGTQSQSEEISGEELAAVSMALYSYFSEMHDKESDVVTIKRVNKPYSPWNSKIYGLNVFQN